MGKKVKIEQFLDADGKITQLPSKHAARMAILEYLAGKFEMGTNYSERQVNEICDLWHTFNDYFLLRRELIANGLLGRETDGSRYWRIWQNTAEDEIPTEAE